METDLLTSQGANAPSGGRARLDALLAERGLFPSRSQAAAAVMAGEVLVGTDRRRIVKPGHQVECNAEITVEGTQRFVSRGGIKLANALEALGVSPVGRRCLDVGASTGGFTDCLLQHGATEVIALDVAYGELAWSIREDPRVHVLERTNIRKLDPSDLPWMPDLIVCDVSFVGVEKVLPAIFSTAPQEFDLLAMVKPQFEVGRELVGKGGVVRDKVARRKALTSVAQAAVAHGYSVLGFASSGLPGPKGNLETFIHICEKDRPGQVTSIEESVRMVEP